MFFDITTRTTGAAQNLSDHNLDAPEVGPLDFSFLRR